MSDHCEPGVLDVVTRAVVIALDRLAQMRRWMHILMWVGAWAVLRLVAGLHAAFRAHMGYGQVINDWWLLAFAITFVVTAYMCGLPGSHVTRWARTSAAVLAAVSASVMFLLFITLVQPSALPRFVILVAPVGVAIVNDLVSRLAGISWSREGQRDRVLFIGDHADQSALELELERATEKPATLACHLAIADARSVVVGATPIEAAVRSERVSVVVLSEEAQRDPMIVEQVARVHALGTRVRPLAEFYDEWLGKLPVSELTRMHLMFDIDELHTSVYGRVRRVFDVVMSSLLLPCVGVVSIVVLCGNRLGNRGPLLYRQERVGLNGRVFDMIKFRTMVPDGDTPSSWTVVDDPRVTRFGRVLRASHLDELPQVWNILKGDLTFVGPRPEQPLYVQELVRKIPHYQMRYTVQPGLTGWAQVKYPYGASEEDAREKLEYDLYYLRHQGHVIDMKILARTLRAVVGRRGR